MFAVIQTGTQQILVKVDQTIFIEKIPGQPGDKVTFDQVLALPEQVKPDELKNIKVQGVIEKQSKQSKIVVYRHNAKSTHKRKLGHRQPYTRVKITAIEGLKSPKESTDVKS
ncbi:50S ribosomal protein L21 [Mycoplasma sp. ATU-Cv-703]|uniref:50S ribosomal protein L21 n=1 Tax=Mycoplasma sp. ATU-Cv-703 TaxID=2498595 RepID=UPI000FDDDC5E